jgi:hypothetical protein
VDKSTLHRLNDSAGRSTIKSSKQEDRIVLLKASKPDGNDKIGRFRRGGEYRAAPSASMFATIFGSTRGRQKSSGRSVTGGRNLRLGVDESGTVSAGLRSDEALGPHGNSGHGTARPAGTVFASLWPPDGTGCRRERRAT